MKTSSRKKKPVTEAGKRRIARKQKKKASGSASAKRKSTSNATKKTKKKRTSKKKGKRLVVRIGNHRIGLTVFCVIAAVAVVFLFSITQMVKGSYQGLGEKMEIAGNPYAKNAFYKPEDGLLRYEDDQYTSMPGIDVSVFQKEIDWEKVRDTGVEFAMIRVGYRSIKDGRIHMDDRFRENLKGASNAGLKVGVYFFSQARTADEAVEEAKYVVRHIRGKDISMPVAYDMEYLEGDRISDLTEMERTMTADAFCSIIEQNGFQPIVYGNPTWLKEAIEKEYLEGYPTWRAHYAKRPGYKGDFTMWQYSETGKIDGIRKDVDLNVYFMKKENN